MHIFSLNKNQITKNERECEEENNDEVVVVESNEDYYKNDKGVSIASPKRLKRREGYNIMEKGEISDQKFHLSQIEEVIICYLACVTTTTP